MPAPSTVNIGAVASPASATHATESVKAPGRPGHSASHPHFLKRAASGSESTTTTATSSLTASDAQTGSSTSLLSADSGRPLDSAAPAASGPAGRPASEPTKPSNGAASHAANGEDDGSNASDGASVGEDESSKKRRRVSSGGVGGAVREWPTSMQVFQRFLRNEYDENNVIVNVDARGIVSKECFEMWVNSRRVPKRDYLRAFNRTLSAHCTGLDSRTPFLPLQEKGVLAVLRQKKRWPCIEKGPDGEYLHDFGLKGFRAVGYHEKRAAAAAAALAPSHPSAAALPRPSAMRRGPPAADRHPGQAVAYPAGAPRAGVAWPAYMDQGVVAAYPQGPQQVDMSMMAYAAASNHPRPEYFAAPYPSHGPGGPRPSSSQGACYPPSSGMFVQSLPGPMGVSNGGPGPGGAWHPPPAAMMGAEYGDPRYYNGAMMGPAPQISAGYAYPQYAARPYPGPPGMPPGSYYPPDQQQQQHSQKPSFEYAQQLPGYPTHPSAPKGMLPPGVMYAQQQQQQPSEKASDGVLRSAMLAFQHSKDLGHETQMTAWAVALFIARARISWPNPSPEAVGEYVNNVIRSSSARGSDDNLLILNVRAKTLEELIVYASPSAVAKYDLSFLSLSFETRWSLFALLVRVCDEPGHEHPFSQLEIRRSPANSAGPTRIKGVAIGVQAPGVVVIVFQDEAPSTS